MQRTRPVLTTFGMAAMFTQGQIANVTSNEMLEGNN
jgi:hypothetical protein